MQANSAGKPVYIVHGGSDSPSTRYTPILNALNANGAIVNSILMPGIGHTIDFPNRNAILGTAFQWIDSVNCAGLMTGLQVMAPPSGSLRVLPSVLGKERHARLEFTSKDTGAVVFELVDVNGRVVKTMSGRAQKGSTAIDLDLNGPVPDTYLLRLQGAENGAVRLVIAE